MIPDTEMERQEGQQILTTCPKCGRLGRLLTDRENADEGGYFDVHYWHPDTDKKCHISKAIDLKRAIDNEIDNQIDNGLDPIEVSLNNTKQPLIGSAQTEIQNKINPRIYKEFLSQAKHEGLTEAQAWEWAMYLFLTYARNGRKSIATMEIKKESRSNKPKGTQRIEPVAFDSFSNNEEDILSLKEFYDSKLPRTQYEKIAVFVYYLTKIKGHRYARFGHIAFCYKELEQKIPSIIDLAKNAQRYKQSLRRIGKSTVMLTLSGRDLVDSLGNNKLILGGQF